MIPLRNKRLRRPLLIAAALLALVGLLLLFPRLISRDTLPKTAGLSIVTQDDRQFAGNTFPVTVKLNTPKQTVNAVEFTLRFDPRFLEVISMTTKDSFCSFYPENTYDNHQGTVRVACGTPRPGFKGESDLVRLEMRSKILGRTALSLDEKTTSVLAHDGKGSDVLNTARDKQLEIIPSF